METEGVESVKIKIEQEIDSLLKTLFPLHRSLTGPGVAKTLSILKSVANFNIKFIRSGKKVFDWVVPNVWSIKDAYIEIPGGGRVVDLKKSNLHVVNYSTPVNKTVDYKELIEHLYSLPRNPKAIPYRTSYYKKDWGFCIEYEKFKRLNKRLKYHVVIDSHFKKGKMLFGERLIKGKYKKEILISTYCCHPSLANDNLSGPVLWAFLLRELEKLKLNYSYRFIIIPETIGAISYLNLNKKRIKDIAGAFILTCVAGPDMFSFKKTFAGNSFIDRAIKIVFTEYGIPLKEYPFDIHGSDERQFSSPFWRIPTASIHRSKYYEYDEYHTSLDNLEFIKINHLKETLEVYLDIIHVIEKNCTYKSKMPYCEPMLSSRGLYPELGGAVRQKKVDDISDPLLREYIISGKKKIRGNEIACILNIMFYSDGRTDLLTIAENTKLPFSQLAEIANRLEQNNLIERVGLK